MSKVVNCHVYKSGNSGFVVAQVATRETVNHPRFSKYPVLPVIIPETGIIEVTGVYGDIICDFSLIKAGIVTREETEAMSEGETFAKFDNTDLSGWHRMAEWLIETKKATGFVQKPFPLDEYGYSNPSDCYYFWPDYFKGIAIPELV